MAKNMVRQGVLFGVGAAAMANELAKKTLKNLAKKHRITASEGKKVAKNVLAYVGKIQKDVYALAGKQSSRQLRKGIAEARNGLKKIDQVLASMEKKAKR